jgi:cytochrome bd-type quinol oxidase subunit 2
MIDFVQDFHSGWRFLVILTTLLTFVFFVYALVTGSTKARQEKLAATLFGTVIDIQVLLGIILLVLWIIDEAREVKGEQVGHVTTMLLLLPVVHVYSIYARRNPDKRQRLRLIGVVAPVVALVLIVAGISSLGLTLFETGP